MSLAEEVVGKTTVEGFFKVGGEEETACAGRSWLVLWMAFHNVVKQLPVVGGGVFDVAEVFQAAFYLEGGDTCIDHGLELLCSGEVF